MSTPFRGIPPRLLQRMRDNKAGTFPSVERTGDRTRTGSQNDPFDDRRTLIYSASTLVAWPQRIQVGSVHYDQSLDPTGQFASVTGSVRAGVSDSLITQSVAIETLGPYIEDQLPEQGRFTDFYLTGTDPVLVGPGFSSPLSSKTTIRLNLPVTGVYQMLASTASMLYYNEADAAFQLAGEGNKNATTNPGDLGKPLLITNAGTAFTDISILNLGGADARLFGPFGNSIITGSNMLANATFGTPALVNVSNGVMPTLLSTIGSDAALLNANLAATENQQITLNQIKHPFLLEKVHVKLPIQAGQTWFEDFTQAEYLAYTFDAEVFSNLTGVVADCGGPAVTFALQRQDTLGRRELIMSATIIPDGDNTIVLNNMTHLAGLAGPIVQPTDAPDPGAAHTTPAGFLSFGTPAAVVAPDPDLPGATFTGSVEFQGHAAISNGVISSHTNTGIQRTSEVPNNPWARSQFNNSLILGINPFGRAMDLRPSGRSFFGKEFAIPGFAANPTPSYLSTIDPSLSVYGVEKGAASPYILLPGDKLILSISKYRPIRDQLAAGGSAQLLHSASELILGQLSSSHDFAMGAGNIELTMYGSMIRQGSEFHFGLNQPLTSLVAHEALGFAGIDLDQFDVEVPVAFSGSYVDDIITGTLGVLAGTIVNTRGVIGSKSTRRPDGVNPTGSLSRNIRLKSTTERYYDTLLPPAGELSNVDNPGGIWNNDGNSFNYIHLGTTAGPGSIPGNSKWYRSFPFEPRFGSIIRQKNSGTDTIAATLVNTVAPKSVDVGTNILRQAFTISKNIRAGDGGASLPGAPTTLTFITLPNFLEFNGLNLRDYNFNERAIKAFYGFGDGSDLTTFSEVGSRDGSAKITYATKYDSLNDDTNNYEMVHHVEIKGWKYGIKNGLPQNSSAVFRRDRFGQFRDMLEQRLYTRYSEDDVGQGAVRVRFTLPNPADTESSNLSAYATSSLPYFEGNPRNRQVLPSIDLVAVAIPTPSGQIATFTPFNPGPPANFGILP